MLLGILRVPDSAAVEVLRRLGVDTQVLRSAADTHIQPGEKATKTGPDLPYTSRAKSALELAKAAAHELGHDSVGTEHLLLGLLRDRKNIAAQILTAAGLTLDGLADALKGIEGKEVGSPPEPPVSVTILTEYANGQVGARKFTDFRAAMGYLARWVRTKGTPS